MESQHDISEEEHGEHPPYPLTGIEDEKKGEAERQDAFGDEEFAEVKYKVLKWWYVCTN
jgi:hypothetical protein